MHVSMLKVLIVPSTDIPRDLFRDFLDLKLNSLVSLTSWVSGAGEARMLRIQEVSVKVGG
jgi:hypothetical protein